MTIGFVGIWLFSIPDRAQCRRERAAFPAQQVRSKPAWAQPLGHFPPPTRRGPAPTASRANPVFVPP